MADFLKHPFTFDLMAHGPSRGWEPWVAWSNVLAGLVIALATGVIGCNLIYLVVKRKDVTFNWVVTMFAAFTFACGATHALEAWNTWQGAFRNDSPIKGVTAIASLLAMTFLLRITPELRRVPTLTKALAMGEAQSSEQQEMRQMEGQLRENEARLQGFIRHAPAAIAFKSLDGRFLLINPRLEAMLGRPSRDILGRTNEDLFPPRLARHFRNLEQRVLDRGKDLQMEQVWADARGATHHALTHLFPLVDTTGRSWGLGVIATDITERKGADRALLQSQKLESLGVLAGGIAHDFNNLLGAMQGNVELALCEDSLALAQPHLETLQRLMARASDLLRQMLTYAGRGKAVLVTLDLNRHVGEMIHLLRTSVSKKATLREDLHPGPLPMEADPSQIHQVVMNLVLNASEALGERNGIITLRTRLEDLGTEALAGGYDGERLRPGTYVSLEVTDDGQGMAPEVLKRIFEPFFTTKFTGRGLGLAAIHGIVRGHQGGFRVLSEPGKGSAFKFLFPAAKGGVQAPAPEPPLPRALEAFQGAVLVVDDEDAMRAVAAKVLIRMGLSVLQARDGLEALRMWQEHQAHISLVILDLTMPNMDGEEACRELRRRGAAVPVILTSGFEESEALARFQDLGLAGFLQKPFGLGALAALVGRILAG
jgi:two-component system, cell cycle sensor histidine kinase and response regulator CckA